MRPPRFWQNDPTRPGVIAMSLAPFAWMFAKLAARRVARPPEYTPNVPVICIGNLNVGGTGKTPTVIALAQHLIDTGCQPHVVSRGYGGRLPGPVRVEPDRHTAAAVGDEPLLLAAFAPVWVSKNRAAGVKAAEESGATVILLDDGFQNPSVRKDLSIVVVDANRGFGNGRVFPAGPLREPVDIGLERADFLLPIGHKEAQARFAGHWGNVFGGPVLRGELRPLQTGIEWSEYELFAFAGIAHPEQFFATLQSLGANVVGTEMLDDHQPLTGAMLTRLQARARDMNAQLVTTEKDAARLPREWQQQVLTLPVRLQIEDWSQLDAAIERIGVRRS